MASVHDALRWANRREVAREITRRGYRVSGETLNRWVREKAEVPAVVEHIVFELFGIADTGKSAPAWAEALADETVIRVIEGVTTPERWRQIETLIARLEELVPLPGEASDDPGDAQDPGAAVPRGRAGGSPRD